MVGTEEMSSKVATFSNPDEDGQQHKHSDGIQLRHASQFVQPRSEEDEVWPKPREVLLETCAPVGPIEQVTVQPSSDGRSNSFIVTIMKTDNDTPLGLDVFQDMKKCMRVRKVRRGLISQWNVANPALQVQERDCIKAINGVSSDVEQMMAVASEEISLQFLISPN